MIAVEIAEKSKQNRTKNSIFKFGRGRQGTQFSSKFGHWLQVGQAMILHTQEMLNMSKEFYFYLKKMMKKAR